MKDLHNANNFNNGFVQLQDTFSYIKNKNKKNFTFCPGKSRKNFANIFQDLQTQFKDFRGQQKKSRTFSGCGNPVKLTKTVKIF